MDTECDNLFQHFMIITPNIRPAILPKYYAEFMSLTAFAKTSKQQDQLNNEIHKITNKLTKCTICKTSTKHFSCVPLWKPKFSEKIIDLISIEFLCEKNICQMFTTISHTKKRPMNILFGNLFENKILDLFEFEVTNFLPIDYFSGIAVDACMKPIVIFQGDLFETDFELERLKRYFFEYFKLYDIDEVSVSVLKRLIVFSVATDRTVKIRSYQIDVDFNENNCKDIKDLKEIGPSLDLKIRRIALASQELYKLACKQPKEINKKPEKNVSTNILGEKRGRIYMSQQNLNNMALKNILNYIRKRLD